MTDELSAPDAQAGVVAFLANPETHGGRAVDRIDTHASRVFMVGERVYKLKRALRLPYMDYSTVERRRVACEAELRLNRRTAPDLYLGVAPVVRGSDGRSDGGLSIGGAGEPVDWVVVMRRVGQDTMFDRLAERGALDRAMMEDLAEAVAAFHASAEVFESRGGADAMAWVVEDNAAELGTLAPWLGTERLARFADLSSRALDEGRPLLDRRRGEGKVRFCHGDLHLRNVCLFEGRPTPFDCIEFNDDIAIIDVLYDLAFLLMDLERRGLRPLGNAVLNRYLERSGEHAGLALMPLFLSARAAVRAKVSATVAAGEGEGAGGLRAEASGYFDLALALLAAPGPRLVVVGGLSGTGKTTLARRIAPRIGPAPGAVVVRTDAVRKRLAGIPETERLPAGAYGPQASQAVYDEVFRLARETVSAGHAVIADGVFARPGERAAIEDVARSCGVPFHPVWLDAPVDRLVERVSARRGDASDATPDVVRAQARYDLGTLAWPRVDAGIAAADLENAVLPLVG